MYLKKLYKQSKLWFVFTALFASAQLFINYKHGVEFSPFYHYDMFSLPFHFTTTYQVTEVTVNGEPLQSKNFTPNGWDNIVLPIVQYQNEQHWNSLIYNTTIKRFMHTNDSALYTNQISQQQFAEWYKQRIIRLLHLQNKDAIIQYRTVFYQQNRRYLHRR